MKKVPKSIILLIVIFVNMSAIVSVTSLDETLLGVASGDYFNMEVKENPRDSMSSDRTRPEGFEPPEGFTRPEGTNPKDQFSVFGDIEIEDFILTPLITPIPSTGVVFSIDVLETPNGTEAGLIESNIKGNKETHSTDFSYGSPIVFTDWNGWILKLTEMENEAANLNAEIETIEVEITTNSASQFQTKITIEVAVPEERQDFIEKITVTQHVRYDKATGIQDLYILESTTVSLVMGEINQITQLEFTTKSLTPPDFPTQLILIILGGVSLVGGGIFVLYKRKYQVQQLEQNHSLTHQKVVNKEKAQLQDIRTRIAELEKEEQSSLKHAEDLLKDKKTFKRRRY